MPPGVAIIVTFRGSNYRCLERMFMVPKGFDIEVQLYIVFKKKKKKKKKKNLYKKVKITCRYGFT